MEFVQLIVYLQVGLYILQDVTSHPTTTDLPVETTVDDVVYETTNFKEPNGGANFNFETTTNVALPFEDTTVIFQEPTQNQQDVVEELNGLWNYSESLDETEGELKSSLNSIVHLAYARVQTEPEETLDRLKNLLRTLRSRLSRKVDKNEDISRKQRSIPIPEIENLATAASLLRIPEEQIASTGVPEDQARQGIIKVTPGDKTIQKEIHVGDREIEQQLSGPTGSSTVIETNLLMSNESGALPSAITAEIIANAILKLLHQNSFPYPEAAYAEKISFSIPKNKTVATTTTSTTTQTSTTTKASTTTTSTSTTKPAPVTPDAIIVPEYDSSENELIEQILTPIAEEPPEQQKTKITTTTTTTAKWDEADFDDLMADTDVTLDVSSENTNSVESATPITTSSAVTSSSAVINMFDELTTSNIMTAPMIFLNGTREGMVQFIQTFNILTFKTKMAILFALSVSVLSIALGVYSLGPPIIAVGALGILIPISLLLVLQSQDQNVLKRRKNRNDNENGGEEPLKEFNLVLDLITEAIEKYNV